MCVMCFQGEHAKCVWCRDIRYVWYDNEFAYSRRLVTLGQRAATAVVGPGTGGTEGSEGSGGGGGGGGGEGKA